MNASRDDERRSGQFGHVPVMARRITELLAPALTRPGVENPVVVDATLGAGGHSELMLTEFDSARVVGIDRDESALDIARLLSALKIVQRHHPELAQPVERLVAGWDLDRVVRWMGR